MEPYKGILIELFIKEAFKEPVKEPLKEALKEPFKKALKEPLLKHRSLFEKPLNPKS